MKFFFSLSVSKTIGLPQTCLVYSTAPKVNHFKLPATFQTESQTFLDTALVPATTTQSHVYRAHHFLSAPFIPTNTAASANTVSQSLTPGHFGWSTICMCARTCECAHPTKDTSPSLFHINTVRNRPLGAFLTARRDGGNTDQGGRGSSLQKGIQRT